MEIFIFVGIVVGAMFLWVLLSPPAPRRPSVGAIIGGAILVAGVLALIAWNEIDNWFMQRMTKDDLGKLIKDRLGKGEYGTFSLRGEISDTDGVLKHSKTWQGKKIDQALEWRFGDADQIIIRA